jgi:hypothetical protein
MLEGAVPVIPGMTEPEENLADLAEQALKIGYPAVLKAAAGGAVDREFVLELVAMNLPAEALEGTFETFLDWARFADLFAYDDARERLTLQ